MITYTDFITAWPAYASLPYTQSMVEGKLVEIAALFPQIESCLPIETHLLAFGYAFKLLELEEDCDSTQGILAYSSMNDKVSFHKGKNPYSLNSTVWGNRLSRMFKAHGCHISAQPLTKGSSCC